MARREWRLFVLAVALALHPGCRPPTGDAPPRLVLLYAPCTVSKTFLSPYSPEVRFTPNLNSFAREGVVFKRHQTEAPSSGIAYASLFSGAQADRHGAYRHPTALPAGLKLIGEIYADAGYEAFFWNGHSMTASGLEYDQGVAPRNRFPLALRASHPRFQELLRRLKKDPAYRALVITNFTITHAPYQRRFLGRFRQDHPERFGELSGADIARFGAIYTDNHFPLSWNHEETVQRLGLSTAELAKLVAVIELLYESTVAELDRMFGTVVEAIRESELIEESLIVFTADHGEVLYRESAPFKWAHSMQLAPEVLGVPWILLSNDDSVASGSYEGVTRSIDVLPTLLGLSGIPIPEETQVEGYDLSDVLRGIGAAPTLEAFSHTTLLVRSVFKQMYDPPTAPAWNTARRFFPDESAGQVWVALRRSDELYKRRKLDGTSWKTEAFDLVTDPWASDGSLDLTDPMRREGAARLEAYQARFVESYQRERASEQKRRLPKDDEARKLRELGYIQ